MRQSLLIMCLVVPSIHFVAHGAAVVETVQASQADAFPKLVKLLQDHKFDEALAEATKATRENPNSAQAFFLLGRTQFYREQDKAAQMAFEKAIALKPAFAEAHFFRGLTFNYGEDKEGGRADFEKATQIDPNKAKYWFELGKLNKHVGKHDAAVSALEKAVTLDPKWAEPWFALGALASGKGDHTRAAAMWAKTLEITPTYADAHFNLGLHHQLRGDAKLALAHFLTMAEQKPHDVDAVKKVIQAYYRLEDFDKAGSYRLKLLELIAKSPVPEVRAMKEFCFDQFDAPGGRFFAYESLVKDGPLVYWFTFKLVNGDDKVVKTINLESSPFLVESGRPFLLGQNEGNTHFNFGIGFKELPPYPSLKQLVLKANSGQLRVVASTTRSK